MGEPFWKGARVGFSFQKITQINQDFSSKMSSEINALHQQHAKHELLDGLGSHTGDTAGTQQKEKKIKGFFSSENQFPVPEVPPLSESTGNSSPS